MFIFIGYPQHCFLFWSTTPRDLGQRPIIINAPKVDQL